jgi:hypothetical protein
MVLINAGPGIFFGLFGTVVLAISLITSTTIEFPVYWETKDPSSPGSVKIGYSPPTKSAVESLITEIASRDLETIKNEDWKVYQSRAQKILAELHK